MKDGTVELISLEQFLDEMLDKPGKRPRSPRELAHTGDVLPSGGSKLEERAVEEFHLMSLATSWPAPRRQFRFHPKRRWPFDFAWPDKKVAVEVEGGTWSNGRHTRGSGFEKDCEKYNEATRMGWRVFRFTANMVRDGRMLATMMQVAEES